MMNTRARRTAILLAAAAVVAAGVVLERRRPYTLPLRPAPDIGLAQASEHAQWPWADASKGAPHRGVTSWKATSRDGTLCELLEFNLDANPRLRLQLYSQDEDDGEDRGEDAAEDGQKSMDNNIRFWKRGLGAVVRDLNHREEMEKKRGDAFFGPVIAACNGPFFGYRHVSERVQDEIGFHLAPIVLRGRAFYNTGNHRWTFGVQEGKGLKLHFKTFHLPNREQMEREFTYASGSIQCLIKDGRALKLEPFPRGPRDFKKQPVPSTPEEAGHIPYFDHAKFSRVSMGWKSRVDGSASKLFWLVVREPNGFSEGQSIEDLARWKPQSRGWSVPDVQRFWLSMQRAGLVDNAINSDAGDCAQLALRQPHRSYELTSPIGDNPSFERKTFGPQFQGAPQGGTVMTFVVREDSPE